LQGFTDEQIDKLLEGSSDAQAYKQAGNAVTVNVVHALATRLKRAHEAVVAMLVPKSGTQSVSTPKLQPKPYETPHQKSMPTPNTPPFHRQEAA
jgi:hypothetical protein